MPAKTDLDAQISELVYGLKVYRTQDFPTRKALLNLPPDEQIEVVCERYRFWVLKFAQELAEKPNAGYAALMLLVSYFEMIAQLSGFAGNKPSDRVKEGLIIVFPELQSEPTIVDVIEQRLRNPLAHMGVTSDHVILIEHYDEPLVWGTFRGVQAVVINPQLWVKHIIQHYDQFVADLRNPDPQYDQLRKDFLSRIANPA